MAVLTITSEDKELLNRLSVLAQTSDSVASVSINEHVFAAFTEEDCKHVIDDMLDDSKDLERYIKAAGGYDKFSVLMAKKAEKMFDANDGMNWDVLKYAFKKTVADQQSKMQFNSNVKQEIIFMNTKIVRKSSQLINKQERMNKMSKHVKGVSGHTHSQQQLNHYANQNNPNNAAYAANNNNHSNQCNPNNSASKK